VQLQQKPAMTSPAIKLYARATPGFDQRVAQTTALLRQAASEHANTIVQTTSLGAEDMVVTDLIARHKLNITLATLDTGVLHAETLGLIPRIQAHYGLQVQRYAPVADDVIHFVAQHGADVMRQSIALRKACCALRKLEPLGRLLKGQTAWVTGLRQEQSDARASAPAQEVDAHGRTKLNPLSAWSWYDVWHYIAMNSVPTNPLHDKFFPSIGCAPCTRAVAVGEPFRAGRWWWEDETAKECGLHEKA
jgi:phosphoadenosine phosphosulfate reductase